MKKCAADAEEGLPPFPCDPILLFPILGLRGLPEVVGEHGPVMGLEGVSERDSEYLFGSLGELLGVACRLDGREQAFDFQVVFVIVDADGDDGHGVVSVDDFAEEQPALCRGALVLVAH